MDRSFALEINSSRPFPDNFSIQQMEQKLQRENRFSLLYHKEELKVMSTNTWLTGDVFSDCLKEPTMRGEKKDYCYNLFVKVTGVEEKLTYAKQLFQWKKQLEDV